MYRLTALGIFIIILFSFSTQPDDLSRIVEKFNAFHADKPAEKLYLHIDKSAYFAGEDLWFKSYLLHPTLLQLDSISRVVYVEVVDKDNKVLDHKTLYSPSGVAFGDFRLSDSLATGKFIIRAYTNMMKNHENRLFFEREFTVFNGSIVANTNQNTTSGQSLELNFFPEGGNLIAGPENRVAFKAVDQNGEPMSVEGEIIDDNQKVVASFKTEHEGMGLVKFSIESGKKYYALVKNYSAQFPLPMPIVQGYSMRVNDVGNALRVSIFSNIKSSNPIPFTLVAQSRGEIRFVASGTLKGASMATLIPKNKLLSGVAQIMLFDGGGVPHCERLAFVDHQDRLKISLDFDKKQYAPRELVNVKIAVRDTANLPVSGNFSLSIFNPLVVPGEDQYPTTIENYLLLTSDLKGSIKNPGYYFKDNLPQTLFHRDLLLLTHGWRRFTWTDILTGRNDNNFFYAEKGLPLGGKVLKAFSKKPSQGSNVKVLTAMGDFIILTTDSVGRFYSDEFLFYDSNKLVIQTDNGKGKQVDLKLELDPFWQAPIANYRLAPLPHMEQAALTEQNERRKRVEYTIKASEDAILLKDIEIKATKIEAARASVPYSTPSVSIKMKDVPMINSYTHIFQILQSRVPGVTVKGTPPGISIFIRSGGSSLTGGGTPPLILVNGSPVDVDYLSSLAPSNVESIDVLKGNAAAVFGSRAMGGVISVFTKKGESATGPSFGITRIQYPGFYLAREFYTPRYNEKNERNSLPDLRNTLYWNPEIKTNGDGNAQLSFYASDVKSVYQVQLEGISFEGLPGAKSSEMVIDNN